MSENPYHAPSTQIQPAPLPPFTSGRRWAILGLLLYCAPFVGAVLTAMALVSTFEALENSSGADPEMLNLAIFEALMSTVVGLGVGVAGAGLMGVALYQNNREKWFYKNALVASILWCVLLFPLGLVVGGIMLVVFLKRRSQFLR